MRLLVLAVMAWLLAVLAFAAEPLLVFETAIPLHSVNGRIDHMAIDLPRRRLMVAELGNNTVDVIDLDKRIVVQRIAGLHEPQGVGYVEGADTIVIANAGDGSVRLIDANDFSVVGRIELHDDADNVRIDPRNGLAVVGYGSGGLALINATARTKIADIRLLAHPEGFRIDQRGRAYVNLPDAHQIAVVDLDARRVVASWPTQNMRANFPMAFDPTQHLIASAFRSPSMLVLLDPAAGGAVLKRVPTCGDADDVSFDQRRQRIYISCGAGELAILEQKNGDWTALEMIDTAGGARTSLFVPELDRLFVAERARLLGSEAAIRVYRPAP